MNELNQLFNRQHEYMGLCSDSYRAGVYARNDTGAPVAFAARQMAKERETKEVILALENELHEFLGEINWKPWKKTRKGIDREKLGGELADIWHFVLELTMLWNFEDELVQLMAKSFAKNHNRLKVGY